MVAGRLGTVEGACVALAGGVGSACRCRVYHGRPAACRRFEAGPELCQLARHEAGLGPTPEGLAAHLRALRRAG